MDVLELQPALPSRALRRIEKSSSSVGARRTTDCTQTNDQTQPTSPLTLQYKESPSTAQWAPFTCENGTTCEKEEGQYMYKCCV